MPNSIKKSIELFMLKWKALREPTVDSFLLSRAVGRPIAHGWYEGLRRNVPSTQRVRSKRSQFLHAMTEKIVKPWSVARNSTNFA